MSYKLAGVIWNDDGTMAAKTNIDQIEPSGNDLINKKLTLQELELLNTASAYNGEQHKAICGRAALELIEYKKIEKELGVDLKVYHKLMDMLYCGEPNILYVKDKDRIIQVGILEIDYCKKKIIFYKDKSYNDDYVYGFIQYGKTWALTKEELIDEKED